MATAVLHPLPVRQRTSAAAVLATACWGVFVCFGSVVIYTFGVFLKPLAAEFHWSRAQVSFAFTLAALTVAVCSPFLGRLLDRFPARRIILPCTCIYGAAFASLSLLTNHLAQLYATFVLLGIVANGTTQLGYARVVSLWFERHRGRAFAAVMAGSGLGSMLFPPLAQWLITHYGWRSAYLSLGAFVLVTALPLAFLFLFEPTAKPVASQRTPTPSIWKSALSYPFLAIASALLLFSFATNGLTAHWAAYLTDSGASPSRAALVLSIAGGATLFGKLATGTLLDRFRAGRVAALLLALTAAGFALVLCPYSWPLAIAAALCVGIGMGAESDVVPYLLTRHFSLDQFGTLYGYTWSIYAIAGAAGPLVMGTVFDRTGSYRLVLAASLCLVLTAALLFASLPNYRPATTAPHAVAAAK